MKATLAIQALIGLTAAIPAPDPFPDALHARQVSTSTYCSPTTQLCYNEYTTAGNSIFRIAISESATGSDFDIALQLVAPAGQGWVGFSFGGSMTEAPLAVAWPNGQSVTASSRWASSHALPSVYDAATYTLLQDTGLNSTHYTLSAICTGCSSWSRSTGTRTLNPNSGFRVAWAQNTQAGSVAQPSDPGSTFNYHSFHGYFDADLRSARVPDAQFQAAAAMTLGPAPAAAVGVEESDPAPAQPGPAPEWPWGPWG